MDEGNVKEGTTTYEMIKQVMCNGEKRRMTMDDKSLVELISKELRDIINEHFPIAFKMDHEIDREIDTLAFIARNMYWLRKLGVRILFDHQVKNTLPSGGHGRIDILFTRNSTILVGVEVKNWRSGTKSKVNALLKDYKKCRLLIQNYTDKCFVIDNTHGCGISNEEFLRDHGLIEEADLVKEGSIEILGQDLGKLYPDDFKKYHKSFKKK